MRLAVQCADRAVTCRHSENVTDEDLTRGSQHQTHSVSTRQVAGCVRQTEKSQQSKIIRRRFHNAELSGIQYNTLQNEMCKAFYEIPRNPNGYIIYKCKKTAVYTNVNGDM